MIELKNDRLEISFPEVHKDARMSLEFQRTLRIPDDDETHYLPPGLGKFPLKHVDDYSKNLPPKWETRGGVFLPMYQSEALWINFHPGDYPFAIKVAAGKINAVTGDLWTNELTLKTQLGELLQDYIVVPGQPWLDGFSVGKGIIRQFIAMPLGKGYTAEEQVTGEGEFGGIQIKAFPLKRELYQPRIRVDRCEIPSSPSAAECLPKKSMGLGLGGRMKQEIYKDKKGLDSWDTTNTSRCFVHIANSEQYYSITNNHPPTKPPSAQEYNKAGLPWFDYYDEDGVPQAGSETLSGLQSVENIQSSSQVGSETNPVVITPDSKKKVEDLRW